MHGPSYVNGFFGQNGCPNVHMNNSDIRTMIECLGNDEKVLTRHVTQTVNKLKAAGLVRESLKFKKRLNGYSPTDDLLQVWKCFPSSEGGN